MPDQAQLRAELCQRLRVRFELEQAREDVLRGFEVTPELARRIDFVMRAQFDFARRPELGGLFQMQLRLDREGRPVRDPYGVETLLVAFSPALWNHCRRVDRTVFSNGFELSTVFLGYDDGMGLFLGYGESMHPFETALFDPDREMRCRVRSPSRERAAARHRSRVRALERRGWSVASP